MLLVYALDTHWLFIAIFSLLYSVAYWLINASTVWSRNHPFVYSQVVSMTYAIKVTSVSICINASTSPNLPPPHNYWRRETRGARYPALNVVITNAYTVVMWLALTRFLRNNVNFLRFYTCKDYLHVPLLLCTETHRPRSLTTHLTRGPETQQPS